ncbi:hypothetical protein SOVF_170960 [Spinacia oleracea]|uniref:Large ribosomal subunit protein uL1c n=1 Tax=Spinacia oleracea TaxID=3562 RepID=A0A9R0K5N8_SPIOL|nr:uncharacterized protein LOC110798543 [Spinacia oleracea]KNA07532.1 hypothetical protein SOVF_170960 [Spinacia oleracea]
MAAAALERFLFHTRRIPRSQISSLYLHRRGFCSENTPQPPPIQPVSYAPKPKPADETPLENVSPLSPSEDTISSRDLTREDYRYLKDSPMTITPVSYSKKVAPLPEDRVVTEEERAELWTETRKIEANNRAVRRVFKVVEEEKEVPFPTLIKVEKKDGDRKVFDLLEAIHQVKAKAKRNFDETLEAHVNLGIDRRRSDLGVSGAVVLPHGTGKIVKVAVFADGAEAEEARAAGADIVGADELIEEIRTSGKINFDKCIATHSMMQRVTKIGRVLRGLTPNAKKGTVTNNVAAAVREAKQGLLDFRMKDAIVHVGLGKVSFPEEALHENVGAFVNALLLAKPVGLKKTSKYAGYVNSFHLCSTMGPGFPISIQSLSRAADQYVKLRPQ